MGYTTDTFYPNTSEQDFTAAGELDIRRLSSSISASSNTTIASFTDSVEDIVLDPYSTRGTFGVTDAPHFGWAINRLGATGMESTADAKRYIPAGTWTFDGRIGTTSVAIAQIDMRVRLYRVSSTGSRTLIGGPYISAAVVPTATGNDVTSTGNPGELTFEADETLLVSYNLRKVNSGLATGLPVQLRLNDTLGLDCVITLPGPIRTRFFRGPYAATAAGLADWVRKYRFIRSTDAPAVGVATMDRQLTLFRTFVAAGTGVALMVRKVGKPLAATAVGVASVVKKVGKPLSAFTVGTATLIKKVVKQLAATGVGVAVMDRRLTLFRTMAASGTGVAFMDRLLTLRRTLTASGTGIAVMARRLTIRRTLSATGVGVVFVTKKVGKFLTATAAVGVASFNKKVGKSLVATALGVAIMTRRLTLRRVLTATASVIATALAKLPFGNIPSGGGATIVRRSTMVIED